MSFHMSILLSTTRNTSRAKRLRPFQAGLARNFQAAQRVLGNIQPERLEAGAHLHVHEILHKKALAQPMSSARSPLSRRIMSDRILGDTNSAASIAMIAVSVTVRSIEIELSVLARGGNDLETLRLGALTLRFPRGSLFSKFTSPLNAPAPVTGSCATHRLQAPISQPDLTCRFRFGK
jgi:hypothetical protein